jgi:hypothetical protein
MDNGPVYAQLSNNQHPEISPKDTKTDAQQLRNLGALEKPQFSKTLLLNILRP